MLPNFNDLRKENIEMPYRPVFILSGGERGKNAQVFATEQEAKDSALDRYRVWTTPIDYDTEECEGPVNYVRVDGSDQCHPARAKINVKD